MAEQTRSGGGAAPWLAFLVGALLVIVAVIGYMVWTGPAATPKPVDITITAPQLPEAPKIPEAPPIPKPAG